MQTLARLCSSWRRSKFRLLALSMLVGLLGGLTAVAFYYMLHLFSAFFLGYLACFHPPTPGGEDPLFHFGGAGECRRGLLLALPALGGLASGILVYRFAPEAEGHGTDAAIEAFHKLSGLIRTRVPVVKAIASAFTIGTGGSAGREGPVAQMSAGLGSIIARALGLSTRERETLVISGISAGIGSIFKAPFGAALFAVEVLYKRDYEAGAFIHAVVSSFTAYSIFGLVTGWQPIFTIPAYTFTPSELPVFAALGLVCGVLSVIYVVVFYGMRDKLFKVLKTPNFLKPTIGGLMLGTLGLVFPYAMGTGYGWIQQVLTESLELEVIVPLIFLKMLATSFTISSGGSGGVFAPSLVIGAMAGAAMSSLGADMLTQPKILPLVGMASFFSGAAKCPLSSIVMVAEMTGDYNILVPAILASTLSYMVSGEWSIYEKQLPTKVRSPAHFNEILSELSRLSSELPKRATKVLMALKAREVMSRDLVTVDKDAPLESVYLLMLKTGHHGFPVVDEGKLVGFISIHELGRVSRDLWKKTKVGKVMVKHVKTVPEDEPVYNIALEMEKLGVGKLVVVDRNDPQKPVGILSKSDVLKAYNTALILSI
ncbi:MAG: chloride channel protein [Thermoproteota archaeon]|nr:MAG: chloride channel protein [Candidatus Korarchaeota archaeon]RLG55782.1 MAG: chloride channel protein [Candidatus Korarchaeota archaeon]